MRCQQAPVALRGRERVWAMARRLCVVIPLVAAYVTPTPVMVAKAIPFDAATLADLNAAFDAGTLTAEQLVEMCLARIAAYDRRGPSLHAVITLNPKALETARALDAERKAKGPRSVVAMSNVSILSLRTTGIPWSGDARAVAGEAADFRDAVASRHPDDAS